MPDTCTAKPGPSNTKSPARPPQVSPNQPNKPEASGGLGDNTGDNRSVACVNRTAIKVGTALVSAGSTIEPEERLVGLHTKLQWGRLDDRAGGAPELRIPVGSTASMGPARRSSRRPPRGDADSARAAASMGPARRSSRRAAVWQLQKWFVALQWGLIDVN